MAGRHAIAEEGRVKAEGAGAQVPPRSCRYVLMRRYFASALLAALAGCGRSPAKPSPAEAPVKVVQPGIADAIAKLGDEDYRVRRDAGEALLAAGRESLPYLAEARLSQ